MTEGQRHETEDRLFEEASAWFARLGADDVTAEERRRFDEWLAEGPAQARAWEEVQALYAALGAPALNSELYRDGFRFDAARNSKRDTANLERVEVLKGPGSILFGRAEPGGIINLVTKQPLAAPYYSLQQQFGSFDFYRTTVDATGPITKDDTVLYRFNLAYEDTESFRDFVENERVFVAPVIQWNISDRTQVKLELDYLHSKVFPDQGIPVLGNRPAPLRRERNLSEPSSIIEQDDVLVGLTWAHAFNDHWTLRHRFNASFIDNGDTLNFFFAGTVQDNGFVERGFQVFTRDIDTYYNVLDVTGKFETLSLKHTLLMGGDYYREDAKRPLLNSVCCTGLAINVFDPVYLPSIPVPDPANNFLVDGTTDWYGLYLQDQIELPHNVHVLAGLRYDSAEQIDNLTGITGVDDDRISPRGGLLWRPLPWFSVYGSYTENFGSPNFTDARGNPLPPQTAQQWEVGAKTELWDGRFSATFAYFDLTKQNVAVPDPVNPLLTRTIGEAESRGVEFDVAGEILPGWRIIGGYSYLPFAEVTKDVGSDGGIGTQGNRFHNAPRHAGSLFSTYEFLGGDLKGLKLGGGVVAVGQREGQVFEPFFQLPGYAVVNLLGSSSWKVGPTKLTAQLNVDNLLDKTYFTGSNSGNLGQFGVPRTFLGSIRVEF